MPDTQFVNDKNEPVNFTGSEEPPSPANDRSMFQTLDVITELGWQCHLAWEKIIGEEPRRDWDDLPVDDKASLAESVMWLINHPSSSITAQHDAWRAKKISADPDHHNLVPFDELPFPQQMKARLWRHIIFAVIG